MSAKISRKHSRIHPLHLFAGLLATALSVPALLGQSVPFPTYNPGENTSATTGSRITSNITIGSLTACHSHRMILRRYALSRRMH